MTLNLTTKYNSLENLKDQTMLQGEIAFIQNEDETISIKIGNKDNIAINEAPSLNFELNEKMFENELYVFGNPKEGGATTMPYEELNISEEAEY